MFVFFCCPRKEMGVSKNNGTPKSSILIGISIINHPFLGALPLFLETPKSRGKTQHRPKVFPSGALPGVFQKINTHKGFHIGNALRVLKPLLRFNKWECQRGPMDLVESYLVFQLSISVSKHHLFEEFCEKKSQGVHPGRLTAGTYTSPMKRKENDLKQTSRELCAKMLILRGVFIGQNTSKPRSRCFY